MAVNFYIEKRTDARGDAPIRVSVAIRGARLVTTTGQKVPPSKWNEVKQRVKQGASNNAGIPYNVINAVLAKMEEYFNSYEGECLTKDEYPTAATLKEKFADGFSRRRKEDKNASSG